MNYAQNIRQLLKANAGTLKSEGKIYKLSSGTDNLVLEIIGQDCNIYVEGTEPTLKEWANNFAVPRIPFYDMGCLEIGFVLNVGGLVGTPNQLRSLVSRVMSLNGKVNIFGNSRGANIAKYIAALVFKFGVPKARMSIEVYGCPPSGDSDFKRAYNRLLGSQTTTINGRFDLITFLPPWGNQHGKVIKINTWFSHRLIDYLKAVERNDE